MEAEWWHLKVTSQVGSKVRSREEALSCRERCRRLQGHSSLAAGEMSVGPLWGGIPSAESRAPKRCVHTRGL